MNSHLKQLTCSGKLCPEHRLLNCEVLNDAQEQVIRSDQGLKANHDTGTGPLEELVREIHGVPREYWPNLLQLVRLFRESVTLEPAEVSFRRGWQEAMEGQTTPVSQLWEGLNDD